VARRLATPRIALGLILLGALAVRLWGVGSGLPFVYNLDEYAHFVPGAAHMSGGSLNPHYFQNPPGFTYVLHGVFSVFSLLGLMHASVRATLESDPTSLYVIGRVVTAVFGVAAVGVLYVAARRLYGAAVALVTAALLAFTFLPVFYSHFALNDVPTLLPLALGFVGLAGISTRGRRVDYVVAGLGLGLATATKYTAAGLAVSIVIAAVIRMRDDRNATREHVVNLLVSAGVALAAFVALNPYAVLDPGDFWGGVSRQQRVSAEVAKLGTDDTTGWRYYLWTLTWGFGVVPCILAVAGGVVALRRNWRTALPWVAFAVVVWLFMGSQERFYARWFLPEYPVLAVFAAVAIVALANLVTARWRTVAGIAIGVVAFAQPIVWMVHSDLVLRRDDTRLLARVWLAEHLQPGDKLVAELIASPPYFNEGGTRSGRPLFDLYPQPTGSEIERYATTLRPSTIETYAANGYCYVMVGSIVRDRALKDPDAPADAVAYYRALATGAERVATFSPVRSGATVPKFNFDISYNWYPLTYVRPGPVIEIYRVC
jgi:4-amino-4-deoxy-L-arabinose transferase-like glycosyltransferase